MFLVISKYKNTKFQLTSCEAKGNWQFPPRLASLLATKFLLHIYNGAHWVNADSWYFVTWRLESLEISSSLAFIETYFEWNKQILIIFLIYTAMLVYEEKW